MKIYLDLVFLLNLFFDFIILLCVSLILRRNVKLRRIILGSFVGAFSILFLFISLNSFTLFLLKMILCIGIILVSFGYKDIKYFFNNLLYFFTTSIILGGFLYYLNINFSYKNIGMVFYHKGLSVNALFLVIFSPIIIYIYMKQIKKLKSFHSLKYEVDVYLKNDKIVKLKGYLDTANNLVEPYKSRKVIVVNNKTLNKLAYTENYILVPYNTVDSHGLLKCIVPKKVFIKGIGIKKNIVVGLTKNKFNIEGIDCILNNLIMEENI